MQEATGSAVTVYTWDGEDRLLSVAAPGETQVYAYAGDGKRRKKTVGGAVTWFVWDGENVLLEADALLAEAARYTDSPGYWGGLVSGRRSGATRYFAFDPQGSARLLLDGSGGVTDTYGYTAFGVEQYATGATGNPYRYEGSVGYYRDGAERLYVRARYLQPTTGRWLSRDPLSVSDPAQAFFYASNLVPNVNDPAGLQVPACPPTVVGTARFIIGDPCKYRPIQKQVGLYLCNRHADADWCLCSGSATRVNTTATIIYTDAKGKPCQFSLPVVCPSIPFGPLMRPCKKDEECAGASGMKSGMGDQVETNYEEVLMTPDGKTTIGKLQVHVKGTTGYQISWIRCKKKSSCD